MPVVATVAAAAHAADTIIDQVGGLFGGDKPPASVATEFRGAPCPGSPPLADVRRMVQNAPESVKAELLNLFNTGNAWQHSRSIEAAGIAEFTKASMGGRDCRTTSDIGKQLKPMFLAAVDRYGRIEDVPTETGPASPWLGGIEGDGSTRAPTLAGFSPDSGIVLVLAILLVAGIGFGLWKSAGA